MTVSFAVFVEELYLTAAGELPGGADEYHEAMAGNLAAIDIVNLPTARVTIGASEHYQAAKQYGRANAGYERALYLSPANGYYWLTWLQSTLAIKNQVKHWDKIAIVADHVGMIAPNEPLIRLGMARLGLNVWYGITPDAREAFRKHLDWVVSYNAKILWKYAAQDNRRFLLCRIYATNDAKFNLCIR